MLAALKLALVAALLPGPQDAPAPPEIKGLAGNLVIVEAAEDEAAIRRVDVAVGDELQVLLNVPLLGPDSAPRSIEGRSDADAVAYVKAFQVVRSRQIIGSSTYAGRFVAEEIGEATITFRAVGGTGGSVTVVVTVAERPGQ